MPPVVSASRLVRVFISSTFRDFMAERDELVKKVFPELRRRCSPDHSIEFLGSRWPLAPTLLKSITIILHPERQFWVIPHPPLPPTFAWPSILAHYSL